MFAELLGFPSGELRPAVISRIDAKQLDITVKTLILSALRCALNIKTTILILLLALTCSARATFIETGRITLSGDFTLNPLYDFNNQSAQPF